MMALLCTVGLQAQVVNNAQGDYRLTLNTGNNAPRSFTIGSAFSPVGFLSALTVRGDQMGGTSITPEVFRTNAPTTANTYWRMFQGGTTAGFERGQLYAVPGQNHFRMNAPNGALMLMTSTQDRLRLNPTQTYATLNGYANVNADGNVLISPNANFINSTVGPFTRLHLADGVSGANNSALGFRPKMRNGITLTGNQDGMYVGQWYNALDFTDAVIAWSDNPGTQWTDRMRFLFHSAPTGASSGSQSAEGLEAMRIWPQSFTSAHIGIGDFFAGNLANPAYVTEPTERLDIVNGRVRVRDLPNANNQNNALTKVLVVEDAAVPSNQRGIIRWRDVNTLVDPCASGWTLNGNNAVTAFNGNPCPPQAPDMVGIGTNAPEAKLHIIENVNLNPMVERGIWSETSTNAILNAGVWSDATGVTTFNNYGVRALARNATRNWGVWGEGESEVNTSAFGVEGYGSGVGLNKGLQGRAVGGHTNYGVDAFANGSGVSTNIGIIAGATGPNAWAGWFAGDVTVTGTGYIPGGMWVPSDENLKVNIEQLTGAIELLAQLTPMTYSYQVDEHPNAALPHGTHAGLMAQELGALIPGLVKDVNIPAVLDTAGQVISPAETIKTINYGGLIPYLIGAFNEQQARLDQLEQALALCCTSSSDIQQLHTPADEYDGLMPLDADFERLLTIAPNPFTEQTTVSYTLERRGRAMLMVNGSDVKHLQILEEAVRSEGQYQYVWHTAHLAPGIYYVTLLLDGEPKVKRAVKVR